MKSLYTETVEEERYRSVLSQYPRWKEWKASKACFLSKKEVLVVEYYDRYFSLKAAAQELDVPVAAAAGELSIPILRALGKMEQYYEYYERWEKQ